MAPPTTAAQLTQLREDVESAFSPLMKYLKDAEMSSNGLVPLDKIKPYIIQAQAQCKLAIDAMPMADDEGAELSPPPRSSSLSSGGPPASPPPGKAPKAPLPPAVLEKARQAALKNPPRGPPRGPPRAPPRGPPRPPPRGPPPGMAPRDRDSGKIEAELERKSSSALDSAEARKAAQMKKRVSGGVALFVPGAEALGQGMLKKITPREKPEVRKSNTFERPSLKHVQRPSDKTAAEEAPIVKKASVKDLKEGEEAEDTIAENGEDGEDVEDGNDVEEELEWEQRLDVTSGVHYYFNLKTEESVWDSPTKFKPMDSNKADIGDFEWEQRLDASSGVHYYFNLKTQESVWEAPAKFKALVESDWEEKWSEEHGCPYYQNRTTGVAVWTKAECL